MKIKLEDALSLINNIGGSKPTEYLVSIRDRFLEFIVYCSAFIQDYIRLSLIGENGVKSLLDNNSLYILILIGQAYRKDKKDTIEVFKEKIRELRKELGEALLTQIDKKVDGIDGKIDRVDGKLDDVLEHMPKKGILKGMKVDNYLLIYFY